MVYDPAARRRMGEQTQPGANYSPMDNSGAMQDAAAGVRRAQFQHQRAQARRDRNQDAYSRPRFGAASRLGRSSSGQLAPYYDSMSAAMGLASAQRNARRTARESAEADARARQVQRVEDARAERYGNARAGVARYFDDPDDMLIMEQLRGMATGERAPFDDPTVSAMLARQSDMAAQAQQQQLGNIPGTPGSPQYESARRALMAQRQATNQQARQNIDILRGRENYAAQVQGLNNLGNFNMQLRGRQSEAERYLNQLLGQEQYTDSAIDQDPYYQQMLSRYMSQLGG